MAERWPLSPRLKGRRTRSPPLQRDNRPVSDEKHQGSADIEEEEFHGPPPSVTGSHSSVYRPAESASRRGSERVKLAGSGSPHLERDSATVGGQGVSRAPLSKFILSVAALIALSAAFGARPAR
jgi:hypothetical protein